MGKLRKIGRQVSRALSKVFGKKLGSLIGGIGLSMVMWGGAKVLFPDLTSAITERISDFKNRVFNTPSEAVKDVKDILPDEVIENAKQKDVTQGNMGKIESRLPNEIKYGVNPDETITVAQRLSSDAIDTVDESKFLEDVTFVGEGTGGKALPKTVAQRTGEFIQDIPNRIKTSVTDDDFLPDIAVGAATSLVTSEIMGEQEEPFISGGVASQPLMEAAQNHYVQDIAPSAMAATGNNRASSFQELANQTLYGTGSLSWLSDFYQPLLLPRETTIG